MRKALKVLFGLFVITAISAGFWFTLNHYETRVVTLELSSKRPPDITLEDLAKLEDEWRLREEKRITNLKADLQALDNAVQDREKYGNFLNERLTALETRLTDRELLTGRLNEMQEKLLEFTIEIKSQEALVLPERFADDLSFMVNIQVFAVITKRTSDGHGELRMETKEGLSGWVSNINGEPIVFAAGHFDRAYLTGDPVCLFADGRPSTTLNLFAWSAGEDVAIFKFKPGYKYEGGYAELGDSDELKRLSPVAVIGSPEALSQNTHFMASYGYVMDPRFKSKYSGPQPSVILHWAICNSGNSGGPLLDRYGRVIGMNVMVMDGSTWIAGGEGKLKDIKFRSLVYGATPINDIKRLLPKLMKGDEVKHGWVSGLEIKTSSLIPPNDFERLGIPQPKDNLPIITRVSQSSGGAKAGIKLGDTLVSVNNVPVTDEVDFYREIMHMNPGETAKIMVRREGKDTELFAKTSTFFWSPPDPPPMVIEPSKKK